MTWAVRVSREDLAALDLRPASDVATHVDDGERVYSASIAGLGWWLGRSPQGVAWVAWDERDLATMRAARDALRERDG